MYYLFLKADSLQLKPRLYSNDLLIMRTPLLTTLLLLAKATIGFGASETPITPYIVGGGPAPLGQYPWMAALVRDGNDAAFERQFCGGVLIDPRWVLTAAHCVDSFPEEGFEIIVGSEDLSTEYTPLFPEMVYTHPEYHPQRLSRGCDLALIRLSEPVENITPVPLNRATEILLPGKSVTVIGWGYTDYENPEAPTRLQDVDLTLVDTASDYPSGHPTPEFFITTEDYDPTRGTFSGDSGGPLLIWSNESSSWLAAGVVSFGNRTTDFFVNKTRYTNVAKFSEWIDATITLPDPQISKATQRAVPDIVVNGEPYVGFRFNPFDSPSTETITLLSENLQNPTQPNTNIVYSENTIPTSDSTVYQLVSKNSGSSFFAKISPYAGGASLPVYSSLKPFQEIAFDTYEWTYDGIEPEFTFELKELVPNTQYRVAIDGGASLKITEANASGKRYTTHQDDFIAKSGYTYWATLSLSENTSTATLFPRTLLNTGRNVSSLGFLNESSTDFRSDGTRIELFNVASTGTTEESLVKVYSDFDSEISIFDSNGTIIAYRDIEAEFSTDELIIASNDLSNAIIGIHNFDKDANGSYFVTIEDYDDPPLEPDVFQDRAVTTADDSLSGSDGRRYYYERHEVEALEDHLIVEADGIYFPIGIFIYDDRGNLVTSENGENDVQVSVSTDVGRSYFIEVVNFTELLALNYEIKVSHSEEAP